MGKKRTNLGHWGEAVAAEHLERQGCTPVAANWRCPAGEADLIVRDGNCLAFVEVRTRQGERFGTPEESVDRRKLSHMLAVAETYIYEQSWVGDWRLDVVAIRVEQKGQVEIEWYKNVSG